MEYKPVHIITNDDQFRAKLEEYGLVHVVGAEDYTEEEGLHYHYLVRWPIGDNRRLSPTRRGAVKGFRRDACKTCKKEQYNRPCPRCGRYYKFIWCAGPEHTANTERYIRRKIEADPTRDVEWTP